MSSDLSVDYAALELAACETFARELPALLVERQDEWVAYRGNERLGFSNTKTALDQRLLAEGLDLDEFIVFCIEPQDDEYEIGMA